MSKTIAICNQKGGVGKTTTSLNVATAIALSGERVLLIDLDPQANATSGLGVDKKGIERSIYEALLGGLSIEKAILETTIAQLSLIPSHMALSGAEVELVNLAQREEKLREIMEPIRQRYDLIVIDCPPSVGLLTVNAMTAADSVLVPLQCEYYALEGLSQLLETIRLVQENLNRKLAIEGILLTMADFRTKLTHDVIQEVRRFFGTKVYEVVIPRSVRLSEAPSHGLPIALYDPDSSGAHAYQQLAQKIKENLDVRNAWIGERDSGAYPGESGTSLGATSDSSPGGSPSEERRGRQDSDPVNPAESLSASPDGR